MAELSSKDVYKFINEFETHPEFVEFARSHLKLKNREINDVHSDYSGSREQKYQMISYWRRKIGRAGTINKLHELKNDFYAGDGDNENAAEIVHQSSNDLAANASQPAPGGGSQQSLGLVNPSPPEADSGQQRGDNHENPRQSVSVSGQQRVIIQANPGQPVGGRFLVTEQASHRERTFVPNDGPRIDSFAALNIIQANPGQPVGGRVLVTEQASHRERTFIPNDGPRIDSFAALNIASGESQRSKGINVEKEIDFCSDITDFKVMPSTTVEIETVLTQDNMIYPIKNNPKGYVLIFDGTPASQKSLGDKDVKNMQKLWTDLDCKVIVKKDATAREIQDVIGKVVASPRMSAFDFLVVFVMAKSDGNYGDEAFIAADEKPVVLKDILTKCESKNFETFAGKPKLFFCQVFASKTDQEIKLPDLDQLLVLSHAPLCASSRDTTGSWFMNAVANVFKTHAHKESVIEMLTRVGSAMDSKIASVETSGPNHSVCFSQTFAKNLYLLPGYPKDDLFD